MFFSTTHAQKLSDSENRNNNYKEVPNPYDKRKGNLPLYKLTDC